MSFSNFPSTVTASGKGGTSLADQLWARFKQITWIALLIAAVFVSTSIVTVVLPKVGGRIQGAPIIEGFAAFNSSVLFIHIVTAIPPLLLGFYLFTLDSRRGGGKLHRWLGTVYCVSIWISAVTGLALASANQLGILAQLGFGCLAVAWFTTTYFAYTTARAKRFPDHRIWMLRSFALTLAVVAIRPMHHFGPPAGLSATDWYIALTWLCWVPNLTIAEVYGRITTYSGRLKLGQRHGRRGASAGSSRPPPDELVAAR